MAKALHKFVGSDRPPIRPIIGMMYNNQRFNPEMSMLDPKGPHVRPIVGMIYSNQPFNPGMSMPFTGFGLPPEELPTKAILPTFSLHRCRYDHRF